VAQVFLENAIRTFVAARSLAMSSVQYADEVNTMNVADLQKSFSQDKFGSGPKRNVLILVGHPNVTGKSLSHALANTAMQNFTSHGDDVRMVDLYKIKFGFGGKADFKESLWSQETFDYQWEQRTAAENNMDNFSNEVREQLENLLWADIIIYVFPLFWFHAPAVMKAWQDRVFAWHLTYGGNHNLEGKQFMTVVTCGASQDVWKNVFNSTVEDVLKGFSVAPAVLMKAKVLPTYIVYNAHGVPNEKQQRHAKFCSDFEMYLNAHRNDDVGSPRMLSVSYPQFKHINHLE
jgi:NAD(P)H dehydrogenase (quinone)